MKKLPKSKKGVMNQVISIFILILVIGVLAGMTFLFVGSIKNQVGTSDRQTSIFYNETGWINSTPYYTDCYYAEGKTNFVALNVTDAVNGTLVTSGNYSLSSEGILLNATNANIHNANLTYTCDAFGGTAYIAVNETENAGFSVVQYLSLLFLALIFGAVLVVVLRVILPYINVGQQINRGF